jgi:hypothetical protein
MNKDHPHALGELLHVKHFDHIVVIKNAKSRRTFSDAAILALMHLASKLIPRANTGVLDTNNKPYSKVCSLNKPTIGNTGDPP